MGLLPRHPEKCQPRGEDVSTLISIMAYGSCNQITFLHVNHMHGREWELIPIPLTESTEIDYHERPFDIKKHIKLNVVLSCVIVA